MQRSLLIALVLFTACTDDGSTTYVGPATPQALVVSGDFASTGILSRLDLTTKVVDPNIGGAGGVAGDPVMRRIDDRVYVINRSGGNSITIYDATTLAFIDQIGVGAGANPQDVAVVGGNLYVPAMGTTGVVRVDGTTGTSTTIDLSAVGDPDGHPDCVSAVAVDTRVFVACGLLDDNFQARGNGVVAVIDTKTDAVIETVELPTPNPYNFMIKAPSDVLSGDILIPMLPSFTDYNSGCVARLSTGASPAASCVAGLDNHSLGGTVIHMDLALDRKKLWLAVGTLDASFQNPTGTLKSFDFAAGTVTAVSPSSQMIQDVATCRDGSVVVADGTFNAGGLRIYQNGQELTSAALAFGLPPTFGNALVCYGGS